MNAGVSGGLPAALGGPHAALATRFPDGLGVGKPAVGHRVGEHRGWASERATSVATSTARWPESYGPVSRSHMAASGVRHCPAATARMAEEAATSVELALGRDAYMHAHRCTSYTGY